MLKPLGPTQTGAGVYHKIRNFLRVKLIHNTTNLQREGLAKKD
jgi:hypothetical protein